MFCDAAIRFCVMVKVLSGLPLRQTGAIVSGILPMVRLYWPVPGFSTLSRRLASRIALPRWPAMACCAPPGTLGRRFGSGAPEIISAAGSRRRSAVSTPLETRTPHEPPPARAPKSTAASPSAQQHRTRGPRSRGKWDSSSQRNCLQQRPPSNKKKNCTCYAEVFQKKTNMALPDTLLARLIEVVKKNDLDGSFLMLGRQRWVGTRKGDSAALLKASIERYLPDFSEEDLRNRDDIYSEQFFRVLGFSQVDSMDYSDFEGASIVHDLTGKCPPHLKEKFDVIYDGGTCEHIFDLPTAYKNIDNMLKPGGVLIGHSPCNNWINHSFYQINPEMVYGHWEKAMGYSVLELYLQPLLPNFANLVAKTTNPNQTGKRPRIKGELPKNSPIILNYAVRKPVSKNKESPGTYQTDYVNKWKMSS